MVCSAEIPENRLRAPLWAHILYYVSCSKMLILRKIELKHNLSVSMKHRYNIILLVGHASLNMLNIGTHHSNALNTTLKK